MTAPDPAVARRDAEEALAAWDDHDSYFRERGSKYEGASRACARSLAVALRALLAERAQGETRRALHFVCTDYPGPRSECVFVECEDGTGRSINAGEWRRREDGLVELVVAALASRPAQSDAVRDAAKALRAARLSNRLTCTTSYIKVEAERALVERVDALLAALDGEVGR